MNPDDYERPPVGTIPTIDSDEPVSDYQDWKREDTRVVSGPLGPTYNYPGKMFHTREAAKRWAKENFGTIYEENYCPGRYFFRVKRQVPK